MFLDYNLIGEPSAQLQSTVVIDNYTVSTKAKNVICMSHHTEVFNETW